MILGDQIIRYISILLITFSVCISPFNVLAQSKNTKPEKTLFGGFRFIRNYSPKEYSAHNQNWAILQDSAGIMYFGNTGGFLSFDGVRWQLKTISQNAIIRSMGSDSKGTVFIGGYNEIGYIQNDSRSNGQYVSLLDKLDAEHKSFADVWQTLVLRDTVYYLTREFIIVWDGENLSYLHPATSFHAGFVSDGQLYVRQREIGLMKWNGTSFDLLPGAGVFADKSINAVLPYGTNTLIATRNDGLFIHNGNRFEQFSTEADSIFKQGQIYTGCKLSSGNYAFGTLQRGIIVIDKLGKIIHHFHKKNGLLDDNIWYLYEDKSGALWAGMHFGISKIEVQSAYSFFGESEGVEGSVLDVCIFKEKMYAATSNGIYVAEISPESSDLKGKFQRLSAISPQAWSLLPFDNLMIAAVFDGIYTIDQNNVRKISNDYAMTLHRSARDPNRIFVGMQQGAKSYYFDYGKWTDEGKIPGIQREIRKIFEEEDGTIWMSSFDKGIYKVKKSSRDSIQFQAQFYDEANGLPNDMRAIPFTFDNNIYFAAGTFTYSFDEKTLQFRKQNIFPESYYSDQIGAFSIDKDREGNYWVVSFEDAVSGVLKKSFSGEYIWDNTPFRRISTFSPYFTYADPYSRDIIWMGGVDRIIRVNKPALQVAPVKFYTIIREIVANNDSTIYTGSLPVHAEIINLPFAFNSLRFRFAATSFEDHEQNLYQVKLEGFDREWTQWSHEAYKDYTKLPHGQYTFKVRSMNISGQEGSPAEISFHIAAPFYLTWWAYLFYAILTIIALLLFRKAIIKRAQKRHERELKELEFKKLQELDILKSRLFEDIAHEFRTPLTLILGPIDKILHDQQSSGNNAKDLEIAKRNARQLLKLINQIMDLSKLEAGKLKLQTEKSDIVPLINNLVHSFESLLSSRKQQIHFTSFAQSIQFDFDKDKMEQVLINLISNAVKFTPENGNIRIDVTSPHVDKIIIDITDSGPGIPEKELPFVFDRFYQTQEIPNAGEAGTGIGLALTRELIHLHGGNITAQNAEGKGAFFRIEMPAKFYTASDTLSKTAIQSTELDSKSNTTSNSLIAEDTASEYENTILIVEDNEDMRFFIADVFSQDFRVVLAKNGMEGQEIALEIIPDIIVSDVMMPEKDGLNMCIDLKMDEKTSHIPIILLTAKADLESRLEGLQMGADDYLAKPFNRQELQLRVKNMLESRRKLQQRLSGNLAMSEVVEIPVIEDVFLSKVQGLVFEKLADHELDIEWLAKSLNMSRSQLFRKLKALTGKSPSLYIRSLKLKEGKRLLTENKLNVSEVAYAVGFSTPTYFSDAFKEEFGIRPSQIKST